MGGLGAKEGASTSPESWEKLHGQHDDRLDTKPDAWSENLITAAENGYHHTNERTPLSSHDNNRPQKSNMADHVSGAITKATESDCRGLLVAVIYGTSSTSMAFINKLLMTTYGFNYQFFLMFTQMLFTIVALEALRASGRVNLPRYTLSRGFGFLTPSIIYAIHSVLALHALSGMNIPMYGVVKRCGPLVTLFLSIVILKKGPPTCHMVSSITLITTGCLVAGYGDLAFDLKAYTFGGISVFTQAFYLVILQKVAEGKLSALETLHLNSINTMPLLLICSLAVAEFGPAMQCFSNPSLGFLAAFFLTIGMGSVLNYLLFLCTTLNSALTTSVVGTLKSIVQTAIGLFTFGGISINTLTVTGISMNLFGGILYTYTKYHQYSRKKPLTDTNDLTSKDVEANIPVTVETGRTDFSHMNGNLAKS